MKYSLKQSSGFSLIEILVSLVVLSIGLMGLAGLQIAALKGTNEAHYRTEASLLIMDLADRMRANILGVADGEYRLVTSLSCFSPPSPNCNISTCDSDQLTSFDKYTFACDVKKRLPNGELSIDCANSDCKATIEDADKEQRLNKTHTLIVKWREAKTKDEDKSDNKVYKERSVQLKIVP